MTDKVKRLALFLWNRTMCRIFGPQLNVAELVYGYERYPDRKCEDLYPNDWREA